MTHATLTNQNQITVPSFVRQKLDLKPGNRIIFSLNEEGILTVEKLEGIKSSLGVFSKYHRAKIEERDFENLWLQRVKK